MKEPMPPLPQQRITHLVLNASHFERGEHWGSLDGAGIDREIEVLDRHIAVNLTAQLKLALAIHSLGNLDCVVFILDTYMDRSFPRHASYMVSRAAGYGLVRALATEFAPRCRVNAVAPGTVLPSNRNATDRAESESDSSSRPLLGSGGPDSVTSAVRFFLSASYITGEVLRVDGGRFRV